MDETTIVNESSLERASGLPDAVRAKVRGRRRAVRVRNVSTGVFVFALVGGIGLIAMQQLGQGGADMDRIDRSVLTIDDPMFDGLDQGRGAAPADPRWRAGARLDVDWVLEM